MYRGRSAIPDVLNPLTCKNCGDRYLPERNEGYWECRIHAQELDASGVYPCCGLPLTGLVERLTGYGNGPLWIDAIQGCYRCDHDIKFQKDGKGPIGVVNRFERLDGLPAFRADSFQFIQMPFIALRAKYDLNYVNVLNGAITAVVNKPLDPFVYTQLLYLKELLEVEATTQDSWQNMSIEERKTAFTPLLNDLFKRDQTKEPTKSQKALLELVSYVTHKEVVVSGKMTQEDEKKRIRKSLDDIAQIVFFDSPQNATYSLLVLLKLMKVTQDQWPKLSYEDRKNALTAVTHEQLIQLGSYSAQHEELELIEYSTISAQDETTLAFVSSLWRQIEILKTRLTRQRQA
jgi:hypothetical protein